MRILLHSRFYPNIGGIETVASLLAHEWHRAGAIVTVVSDIQGTLDHSREFPFSVHYRPNPLHWVRLLQWCDVFVHMNISLKALWPWFIVRRPFIAVHETFYYSDRDGNRDWRERVKLRIMSVASNIAASEAIANNLRQPCVVIPNPFDAALFTYEFAANRTKDLVFVGRLVSDKGCGLLIQALGELAGRGFRPLLTIVGDGPERIHLQELVRCLNLHDQVEFSGAQPPAKVASLLRDHKVMVVPSLWEEPFGVVALEGAASGCVVLGSNGGGLPEAIGPCGITFRSGNVSDLACRLFYLFTHPELLDIDRSAAAAHLQRHEPTRVAQRYIEVFERALRGCQQRGGLIMSKADGSPN